MWFGLVGCDFEWFVFFGKNVFFIIVVFISYDGVVGCLNMFCWKILCLIGFSVFIFVFGVCIFCVLEGIVVNWL